MMRKIIAHIALILACLGSSGCCSYVLHRSVTATEKMGDVTGAYLHRADKYVSFTVSQQLGGYYKHGDIQRYAYLKPNGKVKRYHNSLPESIGKAPLPLIRLPDNIGSVPAKQEAEKNGRCEAVFWWNEMGWKAHVLYYDEGQWNEAELAWDKYIPLSQYPKLIILTPFALVGDVLTLPFALMMPRIDG